MMVWRRRNLILGVMIICTLFGLSLLAFGPQIYTVRAYFYPRAAQAAFQADIQSLDLMEILPGLMDRLDLMARPEYNKALPDDKSLYSALAQQIENHVQQAEGGASVAQTEALLRLADRITVQPAAEGRVIEIVARSTDFDTAVELANGVQQAVQQKLAARYAFVKRVEAETPIDAILVQEGKITYIPTPPDQLPMAMISAVIGFFIGLTIAMMADRIQRDDEDHVDKSFA